MFQALGVHGPELSPGWAAFLDVALVSAAFAFLFSAPRANRMTAAMLATMVVLQLPPSECSSRRVSFESRYGTWLGLALGLG